MKKITLLILMSLFTILGHSRFSENHDSSVDISLGLLPSNKSLADIPMPHSVGIARTCPDVVNSVVKPTTPACPAPTALIVVSSTGTTATLQWTAGSTETQWEIVVQDPGYGTPTTGSTIIAAGTNPFTVTGLDPVSSYEFYVRAVCSASEVSSWSGPGTITTTCDMFPVPYIEGFNSSSITQQCWTVANGNGDADSWNMDYATTPFEGNQSAMMFTDLNAGNNNDWLISPTINLNSTPRPKRLKFHYRVQSTTEPNDFRVVLSTTGGAIANFTQTIIPLASYSNATYVERIVNLVDASNNPLTGAVNIAWHVPNGGLDGNRLFIDNVIVEDIPTCPNPTNLVASSMGLTSATLSWTPGFNETQWEVIALPTGSPAPNAGTVGTLVTSPPPYVFNSLQASTTYDFYIRAVCSSTDISVWTTPVTATTLIGYNQCSMPLDIPVNNINQCTVVRNMSLVGSTVSSEGGTACGTNNSGDIWFSFRAINSAQTIDLLNFTGSPQPIALTLYSGTCGGLNQIACSLNNSITATGLQVNTVYLVRASINAVTTNLNVQFNVCVKTPQPPANGSTLNCMINTVNPDFEYPVISGTSPNLVTNDNTMLGWRTTATDHIIEIWPAPNYENHPAYSGRQFIELNAHQVSAVYQDYATPTSTVFNYGFAHKGRQGVDTVALLAGPPGGPYVEIRRVSTGVPAWSYNTGAYTVPAGQPVTRFLFQSISSVGGATIGNFLDAITFTADNSIISASPYTLDCNSNTTTVTAAGMGIWSADSTNPSATVIANTSANTTTITGFSVPGIYRFNWTTLYCTTTVEITYVNNGNTVPVFTQVAPVCSSAAIPALPTTSNNGVTGTWSPAINNMATTTYTFTPNAGQCATTATMTITVTPGATPTFTQVPTICSGGSLAALPTTSNEGITGTWSPALNNTATTTYTFTPTTGQCASAATMTITVTPNVTPAFTQVAPICSGGMLTALPTTSNDGITGTWSPALNNTATTTYTFTPNAGPCAVPTTMTITVNPVVTPTFTQVAPICSGTSLSALPATSNEGVTGTWSPALNNTATTTYTFTPSTGQCSIATTMTITVNPLVTPTFTQVAPICSGGTLTALPTASNEGVTGTWSPAMNNTTTTTYTFTPDAGLCATTATMTITVTPNVTPTFTQVAPICAGGSLTTLPTTSNEGIVGTWSPSLNNTATTTYTFTPNAGPCAVPTTMTITVTPTVTPTFTQVAAICSGAALSALPTTSNEGVTGIWLPAMNNTATTTYTFTPNIGQCSVPTTMTITVNPMVTPTFTQVLPICSGGTLAALPTTSNEGVTGAWSPALNNTITTTYTFTPDAGQCAPTAPMTITVNPLPTISGTLSACAGSATQLTGSGTPAAAGAWFSSDTAVATVDNTGLVSGLTAGTTTITYTNNNGCLVTATVTINAIPTISGTLTTCIGATTQLTGTGTPATSNAWTTSNASVATIDAAGLVTGVSAGTTTITYVDSNGCSTTTIVDVLSSPTASISISGASTICTGTTTDITISGTPNGTVNYTENGTAASVVLPASGTITFTTANLSAQT
ncbi:Ig-like domain-containing protein, partial [Flavobacterium limnosediminis]|uniref:Ig-like domain-containing protein n=1 Tax=Flavobacterium limnosediminis TaxID=1401027 RepID=UPI000685B5A4